MKCPNCGTEYTTNFCPKCGTPANAPVQQQAPMPPQKPKKRIGKILLIVLGVIVAIGVIGSIVGGGDSGNGGGTTSSASSSKSTSKKQEKKTVFAVGEPATIKDTEITLVSYERSAGDEWDSPKEGMEYIIVTVKYRNVGDENITFNPYDFKMKNSQGQIESQAFSIINTETALSSGELAAGGEKTGTIVFEQPVGDTGLVLQYFSNTLIDDKPSAEFTLA